MIQFCLAYIYAAWIYARSCEKISLSFYKLNEESIFLGKASHINQLLYLCVCAIFFLFSQ